MLVKLIYSIFTISKKCQKDNIAAFSGQSSFFIIVSFFPFLMLLLGILSYINISSEYILRLINALPDMIQPLILSMVNELNSSTSFTLLSLTAISAIWAAGKGFVSIIQGLNIIYDTGDETRNYFILRLSSTIYTIVLIVIIILTLILMVFGNLLLDFIGPKFPFLVSAISFLLRFRILIFMALLTLFSLLIYVVFPNCKTTVKREIPGALFSGIGWSVFSYVFSIYVNLSTGFAITYGSLATLVITMLWLYSCMNLLFLGAEINSYLASQKNGGF